MKVIVTFILFMTLMVMPIVGENTFPSNFHWPSNGDKVTKTHYEYVELDADTLLWDFSSAVATGSSHVMQWLNVGDSILVKKELGNQLSFIIRGDSIAINAYENPLLALRDSISPKFTLNDITQDTIVFPYVFSGTYCGNNHVLCKGNLFAAVSSSGTLILPNDTVNNVVKFYYRTDGILNIYSKANRDNDSIDHCLNHIVTVEKWYSPEYKYELAENILDVYLSNGELVQKSSCSFLCSPEEQVYSIGVQNAPHRPFGISAEITPQSYITLPANDITHLDDNISVNLNANTISVSLNNINVLSINGHENSQISAILCDQLGRVWGLFPSFTKTGNALQTQLICDDLPQGNYLLNITIGNEKIIRKLIIQ